VEDSFVSGRHVIMNRALLKISIGKVDTNIQINSYGLFEDHHNLTFYHPDKTGTGMNINHALMQRIASRKPVYCRIGLSHYAR
jgi:hypothetical protein